MAVTRWTFSLQVPQEFGWEVQEWDLTEEDGISILEDNVWSKIDRTPDRVWERDYDYS